MPRTTKRKNLLKQLTSLLQRRLARRLIAFVSGKDRDNTITDDAVDACLIRSLKVVQGRRYTFRNKHRKRKRNIFEIDLETYLEHSDEQPWLSDDEFLQKYRMH